MHNQICQHQLLRQRLHFHGLREILWLNGLLHRLHIQLADDYKTAFQTMRAKGEVDEPLFDGIVASLDALEAAGWLLGVATGKSDRGLDLCLRHHGLRDRFVTLQTADRHPSKPHPSMAYEAMAEAGAAPTQPS